MNKKKNPAQPGGEVTTPGGNGHLSASDFITTSDPRQLSPVDDLILQAEQKMESDPSRYDLHWRIWTSLIFLKSRWPWREEISHEK